VAYLASGAAAATTIEKCPATPSPALIAPEGYVVDAAARALGDGASRAATVERVVQAYAKWQRIERNVAAPMFE
jgi:hypothetical protein